jgi:hypothetical protein
VSYVTGPLGWLMLEHLGEGEPLLLWLAVVARMGVVISSSGIRVRGHCDSG